MKTIKSFSPLGWLRLGSLFALLLGGSGAALADNFIGAPGTGGAWTVYAFGNAQAVADAFRAINNFTASSTFQSLISLIAVLGVLGAGLGGGFSPAMAKKFIAYLFSVFMICYLFFGVGSGGPVQVMAEVTDTVDGTWIAPVAVPAVVGIPASVISTAGHEITSQIEASFPVPDELKMGKGAPFNLAAALINDASQARISDPNLASSLAYYVQDCFTIGIANGALSAGTLTSSTDFLNDIHYNSVSVMVNTLLDPPEGSNSIVSCEQAWQLIKAKVDATGTGAADFLKSASAWTKTPAFSIINSSADSVASWATNSGITDGAAMVKQSAVLSSFSGAFKQAAAATGNSDFLTGLNLAQAQQTQLTGWIMGAEMFNRSMGYVYAILQVFIYGITPLILAAALVPGLGFALIKNFGQILLWLAIWQPMLAIVNFIVLSMQHADLGGVLSNGAGAYGFTLSNMGVISEKTSTMRAAALFIGAMVPALAWAMVKGSIDFSRIIGEAAGEKFAHSAANSMVTGNYSLNQGAMDSFTANKHSIGYAGDYGEGFSYAGLGAQNSDIKLGSNVELSNTQRMATQVSATTATSDGGQLADNGSAAANASQVTAAAAANAYARQGSRGNAGAKNDSTTTSTSGQLSGNAAYDLIKPDGTKSSKTPVANQTVDGKNTGTESNRGDVAQGSEGGRFKAGVSGTVVGQAASAGAYSYVENATDNTSGTQTLSGTNTTTGQQTYGSGQTAGTTAGYNHQQQQNVTGVDSLYNRNAALRQKLVHSSSWDRTKHYESPSKSGVAATLASIESPGAIASAAATREQQVKDDRAWYSGKERDLASRAGAEAKDNEKRANDARAAALGAEKPLKGKARRSTTEVVTDVAGDTEVGKALKEKVKQVESFLHNAKGYDPGKSTLQNAKDGVVKAGAAIKHKLGKHPAKSEVAAAPAQQPTPAQQPAQQPASHTADPGQAHQAPGSQPDTAKAQDPEKERAASAENKAHLAEQRAARGEHRLRDINTLVADGVEGKTSAEVTQLVNTVRDKSRPA